MDINEAYSIIGVDKSISDDDLKSKYKELAKKYHPDVYKEDQEKFKKINEGYQTIQDHRAHPEKYAPRSPFPQGGFGFNINDLFNNFQSNDLQQKQINLPPIQLNIGITFNESILGVSREVKYIRCIKCDTCNGTGKEIIGNGCTTCNGLGRITKQSGNTMFTTNCSKCQGKNITKKDCANCAGKAIKETDVAGAIQIPPGTENNSTLRLQGAGHYSGGSFLGDTYGSVLVNVRVSPVDNMSLVGQDVVSKLKLSMYDAMIGCNRYIDTVLGIKQVFVDPMSRNKDEIKIPNCGVANTGGVHRIILDVEYPTNKDELIGFLKGK